MISCESCLFNDKKNVPATTFIWGVGSYYRPIWDIADALVAYCDKCADFTGKPHEEHNSKIRRYGTEAEYVVQEIHYS